ncbi:hypothetical protein AB0L99_24115 [Streptomyces sp. NPDC051954]
MTGPHEPSEPGDAPKGEAGDAAGGGHGRGSAGVRIARKTVSAVLIVLT